MPKVLCPNHADTNPSMELYESRIYCFVCGYTAKRGDEYGEVEVKEPTNISHEMEYINALPKRLIRGLLLPCDSDGFYVVWPSGQFYKKRIKNEKLRYIGPRGHRPPVFELPSLVDSKTLIIIEGELNALSLYANINTSAKIISPGSVSELPKLLNYSLKYDTIYVIVDKDIPGVAFSLKLKEELIRHKKRVEIVAVEKDINQILQDEGNKAVSDWYDKNVGLP